MQPLAVRHARSDGQLVLTRAGSLRAADALVQGENVVTASPVSPLVMAPMVKVLCDVVTPNLARDDQNAQWRRPL